MIFKRSAEHKLPKFPENVESTFRSFCISLPLEAIEDVKSELEKAVKKILKNSTKNDRIEVELVNNLHDVSNRLLDNYQNYNANQRALIIGAIRYFVVEDDPVPDSGFSSGYYDDAKVMNYVLSQIGEEDLIINT